ncbi:hypothetical protein IMCC9480_1927 [Oxalobacteraceae bacterium IMCC9480]|nr:hypothetical protein IMCC9480_1927 [Oxalobacteraceae bacterium IMCC9480]
MLLTAWHAHKIDPTRLIPHRFKFDQIVAAHDAFGNADDSGALKITI